MTASKPRSERWDEEREDREFTRSLDQASPQQFKSFVKALADLPRPTKAKRPAEAPRDERAS